MERQGDSLRRGQAHFLMETHYNECYSCLGNLITSHQTPCLCLKDPAASTHHTGNKSLQHMSPWGQTASKPQPLLIEIDSSSSVVKRQPDCKFFKDRNQSFESKKSLQDRRRMLGDPGLPGSLRAPHFPYFLQNHMSKHFIRVMAAARWNILLTEWDCLWQFPQDNIQDHFNFSHFMSHSLPEIALLQLLLIVPHLDARQRNLMDENKGSVGIASKQLQDGVQEDVIVGFTSLTLVWVTRQQVGFLLFN